MPLAARQMDREMVTLCEVGQTEKEKYCTIPQRNNTNELIYKTETDQSTHLQLPGGGRMGEEVDRYFRMDTHTLLYLKWITNKDLLYSTGNSAQCHVPAWMGGEFGENGYMYIYG